ncbi:MAG TPA: ImmA/IrrE family metallo-endopeptidase [Candidatus Micrarchaeaceae archaeon]|nr:ImmA/IrrE family metallo-endopeptidase [Candidatus Micrarchaeaceae archaeon]
MKLGRQTRLALRISNRLQLAGVELVEDSPFAVGTTAITDEVIEVARRERRNLGVDLQEQITWKDNYAALRAWREAVQDRGIFVFQLPMPTKELRGFSLSQTSPPVIVFSSSDNPAARIFTLIHEYGHLLLGTGGMCLPDTAPGSGSSVIAEESFCNSFAGTLLVPPEDLVDFVARQASISADAVPSDDALNPIANRYRVSRQVVWYRLFAVGLVTESVFRAKWAEWRGRPTPKPSSGGKARTSAERAMAQYGSGFVNVVLSAHGSGKLSTSDALDYLSIHSRHWTELTHLAGVA